MEHDIHCVCGARNLDPVGGAIGAHDAAHQLRAAGDAEGHRRAGSVQLES